MKVIPESESLILLVNPNNKAKDLFITTKNGEEIQIRLYSNLGRIRKIQNTTKLPLQIQVYDEFSKKVDGYFLVYPHTKYVSYSFKETQKRLKRIYSIHKSGS